MSDPITYRTEIGKISWICMIMVTAFVLVILILSFVNTISFLIFSLIFAVVLLLCFWLMYSIKYTFEEDKLIVKVPLWIEKPPVIPYISVKKIIVKSEWSYVIGASTNCVAIYYGDCSYTCISPMNREEFIKILRERCPQAAFETKNKV